MKGNGDFLSEEVQQLYKEADVIITNPPFSLMRVFVQNLFDKNKKFLIIGSKMAFNYSNLFPLFKNGKLRTGYTVPNKFLYYDKKINSICEKNLSGMCRWFTNLDTAEKEELQIFKKYDPKNYQFIDKIFNTINIAKLKDIPYDFDGNIALPITILDKKYENQIKLFEIRKDLKINGEFLFVRIIGKVIK